MSPLDYSELLLKNSMKAFIFQGYHPQLTEKKYGLKIKCCQNVVKHEKSPPTGIPVEGFFKYDFLVAEVGFEPTTFGL